MGPVEMELRRRAEARGLDVGSSLPDDATSWVAYLLTRDRGNTQMRQAPLTAGCGHSMFVDTEGRLLLSGHAVDPAAVERREIGAPTPVPSMQNRRIVAVACSDNHSLALSAVGGVYSWGDGRYGELGLGDRVARAVPCRIESLSRIESITAGPHLTSAAVDESGKLFTWGRAAYSFADEKEEEVEETGASNGLGHEMDAETEWQLTPKRVEALLHERVAGVALGHGFTLAVTDAGAVFSFGYSADGELGHGSLASVVLPRRIEILTQKGQRFVAVTAGIRHVLALTEQGELFGWGHEEANGHWTEAAHLGEGHYERTPHRLASFVGKRVKLVVARKYSSCAVTAKGELFTWGLSRAGSLGHGCGGPYIEPKRVEGLSGVKVAAVAIGASHMLAADEDGVVWAFGQHLNFGLDASGPAAATAPVLTPTPIPTLRVRVVNSP